MTEHIKVPTRVAAGLKAAINNPNVSEEARERAIERLRDMDQGEEGAEEQQLEQELGIEEASTRVLAGYKATLSNPYTSQEAKQHAEEVLQAAGILERHPNHTDEEHERRVLAGYKAALSNPRVSDPAKQHARRYLEEHGVEI